MRAPDVSVMARSADVAPPPDYVTGGEARLASYSRGAVLVLGDGIDVLVPALALAAQMKVVAFAPGLQATGNLPANLSVVGGRIVSVTGHLGRFRARAATGGGEHRDMGPFSPNKDGTYDLVLDLSSVPLICSALPPIGYFAPTDSDALAAALSALPRLVGTFQQRQHIELDPFLCVHSRQGIAGCSRCIDVCDAGAIRSNANVVSLDASLCHACAACTLACPTGALSYQAPRRMELLAQLDKSLIDCSADGATRPVLLVHVPADGAFVRRLPAGTRALEVPALPAFGDELWVAALAGGMRGVLLLDHEALNPGARRAIEHTAAQTRALVYATGRGTAVIALATRDDLTQMLAHLQITKPASHAHRKVPASVESAKRQIARTSLAGLSSAFAAGSTPLPAGSSFGAVRVQRSACTLCLACVNLCPTHALQGSSEPSPRLEFIESACIQCGLCVSGCGERALTLQPRAAGLGRAVSPATMLAEDETLRCTECRKPFIGRKMLSRSLTSLKAADSLDRDSQKLLYQCGRCRSRSLFA